MFTLKEQDSVQGKEIRRMDYITKVRKDKRRYFGYKKAQTKYQQRKESTVFDFLFFQKKIQKRKKLNEFQETDIEKYLELKKQKHELADATLSEKKAILLAFFRRNQLGQG